MTDALTRVRVAIAHAAIVSGERNVADLPWRDLAIAAIEAMHEPKPPRGREYRACLSCHMPDGKHDAYCPYDGKTHLAKPHQEDDNW